jgi:uncharacterized protein (TIGR02594 family)
MSQGVYKVQDGLRDLGYDPGPIDGLYGPKTAAALMAAGANAFQPVMQPASAELPWIAEGLKTLGWHEVTDKAKLQAWLKSGGKALGDPASLPWCGDWVESAMALALPNEPRPDYPFFAQNWAGFGIAVAPTRGAVGVIRWSASSGHVAFLLGQHGGNYVCLGGNQSNRVSIAEFPKSAFIATRWPATFAPRPINLPEMSAATVIADISATR